ncbi:biosynthetic-type acetolactate synthase large subunit [Alphaproteobacteria bacterium]|nr:biosynthetic-type acetolactate synthase large subunit [Alphaproteobacteria bacterium]
MSLDQEISGAEIILQALKDQEVDTIFGYPGGAVLPIYDAIFGQNFLKHVLVRQEAGAVHAAEGFARSSGKVGVLLVTSGPGVTNVVTGLTDALMDSIPIVCISGQVPSHLIGTDAFQECDTTGITRPCTKHNYLVKDVNKLSETIHEAFEIARSGRPGPVLIDVPKDIQFAKAKYTPKSDVTFKPHRIKSGSSEIDSKFIEKLIEHIQQSKKPVFYVGGGCLNSGPQASQELMKLVQKTNIPVTTTLHGLGCYPGEDSKSLSMLGMHGTYEANLAMNECDLMINFGARFDDRVTGRLDAFSPNSVKFHFDIDQSSINKNVKVDYHTNTDISLSLKAINDQINSRGINFDQNQYDHWWSQIEEWRGKDCLHYEQGDDVIKPQHAIKRLYELTNQQDTFITTEVGQHQMWAAQYYKFSKPNRWITSGGLGTMGFGMPAAIGAQMANPEALVVDIAGEASFLMNIQEIATAVQYKLPIKIFILNNEYMGMVRQWQELLHGSRYSESYVDALPDFKKLAESFNAVGVRAKNLSELDDAINEMISVDRPVIADIWVDKKENCFPMIPSGAAHNEMLLSKYDKEKPENQEKGKVLV